MIAPEPALAGPRPAATPRESGRAAEPQPRRGGDFDSVLAEPALEASPMEAEAGQVPVPALADAVLAIVPPVPAAPAAVETRAPTDEATAAAVVRAPGAPAAGVRAEVPAPAAGGAPAPAVRAGPPAMQDDLAASGDAPAADAEAAPADDPAPVAKVGGVFAAPVAAQSDAAAQAERPIQAAPAVPRRAAPPSEGPLPGGPRRVEAAAPGGEAAVQAVALRDAAPPAWQLAVDSGPSRAEAVAQPQAQAQAQAVQTAQPQAVIGQLAVAIGKARDTTLEIRLDPPELGRVQIQLTRVDGGIQAVVLADRPETQDLLRRHAEVLARELGQAGYDTVSLDFAAGHEAHGGRDQARGPDWAQVAAEAPAAAAVEIAPAAAPRRSLAGGLDIRL